MIKNVNNTTALAIFACLLWSSAFVGIKIGLQYSPPIQFAGLRFMLSGLMILPFAGKLSTFAQQFKENWKHILLLTFLQTIVHYTFFYLGISMVSGALSAIIVGSSPLFIAITAHFMMDNDKMNWQKMGSMLFGLLGVVLVTLGRNDGQVEQTGELAMLGILLLMLTNLNAGFINVVIKRGKSSMNPLVLSTSSMFIGGLILFVFSIPFEGFTGLITAPQYYAALLWLGFVSAAGFSVWFTIVKRPEVKISDVNLWKFLIPVVGAILSWLLLPNEYPSPLAILGMIFTAMGLLWLNYQNRKKSRISNQ